MERLKTIFILGNNKVEAEDYIKKHVKIVTSEEQIRGYTKDNILIVLPQGEIVEQAKARQFKIIEV